VTPKDVLGAFPTWMPNGKRIVFGCERKGSAAICEVEVPGGRVATIWRAPADFGVVGLNVSPDGRRILFLGGPDEAPDVYAVGVDGKGLRRLTTDPAIDGYPAWSPDGRQVIFSSKRSGGTELYVMNADGSSQTRVTDVVGHDEAPDWGQGSP